MTGAYRGGLDLALGRKSDGEAFVADLTQLPHLFISYSDRSQLDRTLMEAGKLEAPGHRLSCHLAVLHQRLPVFEGLRERCHAWETFHRDDPSSGTIETRSAFISRLHRTLNDRKRTPAAKRDRSLALVVMDDIWDMVMPRDRTSAKRLAGLLQEGGDFGIHFITASPTSYRNLLPQLMQANGNIGTQLRDEDIRMAGATAFGAELIGTTDELLFLRMKGSMGMERLFRI